MRIRLQMVYLGGDPRKHQQGSKEVPQRREGGKGHSNEQVITQGIWDSVPLGPLRT